VNKLYGLGVIVLAGWVSIRLMNALSADAAAMAIGVLMGILAGVPTTLLGMASNRRHQDASHLHQARYTVIAGSSGPFVLDNATGERFAIVAPHFGYAQRKRFEVQR